jgi:hypothetical protein
LPVGFEDRPLVGKPFDSASLIDCAAHLMISQKDRLRTVQPLNPGV